MHTRKLLEATAILALLSAGCSDTSPSPSTAPLTVTGRISAYPVAASASPTKVILPTGRGIDVATDPSPPSRTKNRMDYRNGLVMVLNPANVYFVLYGSWGNPDTSTNFSIVGDAVMGMCSRPYTDVIRMYADSLGRAPNGCFILSYPIVDAYSHGTTLSDADVADVVVKLLDGNRLPEDPFGIYVVISSADVGESSGYGSSYCAWHGQFKHFGIPLRLGYVGWPERAPAACAPNGIGPNGTVGADAAASHLAGLLADYVTDPQLNAWYDKLGLEIAEKCVWTFGTTYTAPNGAKANIHLGARDFLLQQLWVPEKNGGHCALHP